ncbi:hypothetical protein BRW65_18060 [Mycobacterium paraffinicum]|uniref:Uncharacterized protein n=1 Tax=Mycobacterium paraffinicum TaxID=53378 RepID=A0A1Q4HSL3_9MYCO|nr:hypothetical protein BRW65_18060 [Mycobacterium paraffinicum]
MRADLASRPPLTYAQVTQIVDLLDRPSAAHHPAAVIVTLRSLIPGAAVRLEAAPRLQAIECLQAFEAAMIEALTADQV